MNVSENEDGPEQKSLPWRRRDGVLQEGQQWLFYCGVQVRSSEVAGDVRLPYLAVFWDNFKRVTLWATINRRGSLERDNSSENRSSGEEEEKRQLCNIDTRVWR